MLALSEDSFSSDAPKMSLSQEVTVVFLGVGVGVGVDVAEAVVVVEVVADPPVLVGKRGLLG